LESSLPSPAPEILDYLSRHPDAQDTIDGILQWWVLESCIRQWKPKVHETVAQLVGEGLLQEKRSLSGQTFYRLAAKEGSNAPSLQTFDPPGGGKFTPD
jgi:hypothetical protein